MREEFKRNWGPEQNLYSPMLVIPYQAGERPRQYVKITPARLDLAAALNPQERQRGLFQATVYDARVDMQGAFVVPAEARLRDFVTDKDGAFPVERGSGRVRRGVEPHRAARDRQHHGRRHRAAVDAVPRSAARTSRPAAAPRW